MKSGVATSVLTEWHFLFQSYPCCPRSCSKRPTCPPLSIQVAYSLYATCILSSRQASRSGHGLVIFFSYFF
uniref:Uncharacterized protein n=1 Tax=Anguilla anguilla TaxID=7936 RepID=A0A0E9TCW8_ANGAN